VSQYRYFRITNLPIESHDQAFISVPENGLISGFSRRDEKSETIQQSQRLIPTVDGKRAAMEIPLNTPKVKDLTIQRRD
jgi:hypothetical protein